MTTPSGASSEDDYWRRPTPGGSEQPAGPPSSPPGPPSAAPAGGYTGPPPSTPPPTGWRPPVHLQPASPRQLPAQDAAALDTAEQRSRTVTYGVGTAAGVVLVILVCLLCSRAIF